MEIDYNVVGKVLSKEEKKINKDIYIYIYKVVKTYAHHHSYSDNYVL